MKQELCDGLCRVAAALAETFGSGCETVVHDFSNAVCRIVAIYNSHVSGRTPESTETIYGITISQLDVKELNPNCDYVNTMVQTRDGRQIKTTSINFIGPDYHYVLGVNFDVTALSAASGILGGLLQANGEFSQSDLANRKLPEAFFHALTMAGGGKPASSLTRPERLQLCTMLNDSGFFLIQKAVPYVAEQLGVSRYTMYNYLKEIRSR